MNRRGFVGSLLAVVSLGLIPRPQPKKPTFVGWVLCDSNLGNRLRRRNYDEWRDRVARYEEMWRRYEAPEYDRLICLSKERETI